MNNTTDVGLQELNIFKKITWGKRLVMLITSDHWKLIVPLDKCM